MKYLSIVALLLTYLLGANGDTAGPLKHFRTDGYYEYDNGVDSFIILPDGAEVFRESRAFLRSLGVRIRDTTRDEVSCRPRGVAVAEGSQYRAYLFFLDGGRGLAVESPCPTRTAVRLTYESFERARTGIDTDVSDKSHRISDYQERGVSGAAFIVGGKGYFRHDFTVAFFPTGDSFLAQVTAQQNPATLSSPNANRVYHFIPFTDTAKWLQKWKD